MEPAILPKKLLFHNLPQTPLSSARTQDEFAFRSSTRPDGFTSITEGSVAKHAVTAKARVYSQQTAEADESDAYYSRFSQATPGWYGLLPLSDDEDDELLASTIPTPTPSQQAASISQRPSPSPVQRKSGISQTTPGASYGSNTSYGTQSQGNQSYGYQSYGSRSSGQPHTPTTSQPAASISASSAIAEVSPVEDLMHQLKLQWMANADVVSSQRSGQLHEAFMTADHGLHKELQAIEDSLQKKRLSISQADVEQAMQQYKDREKRMAELQRSHAQAAAAQQEQVAKLQRAAEEEAARRKREQEEQERKRREADAAAAEAKRKADDAERQKQEEARAAEEAKKKAEQQQQAQQAQQAAAAAQQSTSKDATPSTDAATKKSAAARCMRCSPQAIAFEKEVAGRAAVIQDDLKALISDDSLKKQRRDIEKKMTVHVQQISATLDQVNRKCKEVFDLIVAQPAKQWKEYALLMFATKVLRQWELVALNNKAAFPLGTVLVKISTQFPELMDLMLSLIHRECCYSVPAAFVAKDPASGAELAALQLKRLLGYKDKDDAQHPGTKVLENDDSYIQRIEGVMYLYGAIVQVPDARNPHGLDAGWRYISRLLNALPATRQSAKALIFFLRACGFAMYSQYKGQFVKLLKCMYDDFLPELAKSTEPDVQSVRTLLEHYLVHGQYKEQPEGRDMPRIDISSYQRA